MTQQLTSAARPQAASAGGVMMARPKIDARVRLLVTLVMLGAVASLQTWTSLGAALLAAAVAAALSRLEVRAALVRLMPVNVFAVCLVVLMPLSTGRESLLSIGPIQFTREGLGQALTITLKANAMMLWTAAMLGSLDVLHLARAIERLGAPRKLVQLFFFTVRYLDVLRRECSRLRTAMRARGFRPRVDLHTYRSVGRLVGVLLVRSLDRSERVAMAMKCRGFRGEFHTADRSALRLADLGVAAMATAVAAALVLLERL